MSRTPNRRAEPRGADRRMLYYGGLGALLGNLALVAGLAVVRSVAEVRLAYQVADPVPIVPFAVYAFLGCAAVGTTVAILYERYRTVSPAALATVVYVAAVAHTVWTAPHPRGVATGLDHVLLAWPLVLLVALTAGGLERVSRR